MEMDSGIWIYRYAILGFGGESSGKHSIDLCFGVLLMTNALHRYTLELALCTNLTQTLNFKVFIFISCQ